MTRPRWRRCVFFIADSDVNQRYNAYVEHVRHRGLLQIGVSCFAETSVSRGFSAGGAASHESKATKVCVCVCFGVFVTSQPQR